MNNVTVNQLAIEDLAKELRKRLQSIEELPSFCLTIQISGRVHDGETLISYKLNESDWASGDVEGNRVQPVVEEFMRRYTWNKRNAPVALPSPIEKAPKPIKESASKALNDEIPF